MNMSNPTKLFPGGVPTNPTIMTGGGRDDLKQDWWKSKVGLWKMNSLIQDARLDGVKRE